MLLNIVICINICITCLSDAQKYNSEIGLSVPEVIRKHGYPVETHSVLTEDGYYITIFRISPKNNGTNKLLPVLVVHGLAANSGCFVCNGDKSLAFILADLGYNVWLTNSRSSTYSAKHIILDPVTNPKEFYDFSFHEMGYYDRPAEIDYILTKSENVPKLHYIGHSQGGITFLIMCATRPDYNQKIALASLMSPPAWMKNTEFLAGFLSQYVDDLETIAKEINLHHIPNINWLRENLGRLCVTNMDMCELIYNTALGDADPEQLNKNFLASAMSISVDDFSSKQLGHFLQLIKSGFFRQYDYGRNENIERYGSPEPPNYDVGKITAPVALYYGSNDLLVNEKDINVLKTRLPNLVVDYLVPWKKFNHGDFVLAIDVVPLLYDKLISEMSKYNKIN